MRESERRGMGSVPIICVDVEARSIKFLKAGRIRGPISNARWRQNATKPPGV
jgi:hypothetical protein